MPNDSVRYSRAGDAFHYSWAARRCLGLVYPNSNLTSVVIEGTNDPGKAGEEVIDVSEYYELADGKEKIEYYQLKHTTVRGSMPFTISELKKTLKGFAKKFKELCAGNQNLLNIPNITFSIITNRPIAIEVKENIQTVAAGKQINANNLETIEKCVGLKSNELLEFCKRIQFQDSEGNYNLQKHELRIEITQLLAGAVETTEVNSLAALVQEKALPNTDGKITKEDVLRVFGLTSERELYPASGVWDDPGILIEREQYKDLVNKLYESEHSAIIRAAGGVGKSVFCRQLIQSLPEYSLAIAYDCFGAGSYLNRSESRHLHGVAFTQIVNELAAKGLCPPWLPQDTASPYSIINTFSRRIEFAVKSLKKINTEALLFILIDAADNAEMAAERYGDKCFANELLMESMPAGSRLVMLCRTERINLLHPKNNIIQLTLEPFSKAETFKNLSSWFPEAIEHDGIEFHRLTAGNPRVQANALSVNYHTLTELLESLGPSGTTVDAQIGLQLEKAVGRIKDSNPPGYQAQTDSLCKGLAILPPNIPIKILARAANVSEETVKSFVTDIGRALWLSDLSVRFRDEPTETWFRETFAAEKNDYEKYIEKLEELAEDSYYVAEVFPQLLLMAEQYDELIELAVSEDLLPENNPIDRRTILVFRLQFAFKAALRGRKYADAIKVAIRAGEEMAGMERQLSLQRNNIDLLIALQNAQEVQDMAFNRRLRKPWAGSENVYSASLLSGKPEYRGEAKSFLRAAVRWLEIYFEEWNKNESEYAQNEITDDDILELAHAHLKIYRVENCLQFLKWPELNGIFNIIKNLSIRLIDSGEFETIDLLLQSGCTDPNITVPITSELLKVGRYPEVTLLLPCLDLLATSTSPKNERRNSSSDCVILAIISFLEACIHRNLSSKSILKILENYVPVRPSQLMHSTYNEKEKHIYIRALAIRVLLSGKSSFNIQDILPKELIEKEQDHKLGREIGAFKEVINGMFPWYFLRARIIAQEKINLLEYAKETDQQSENARRSRYHRHDQLPWEIATIVPNILILYHIGTEEELRRYFNLYVKGNKNLWTKERLNLARAAFRLAHLKTLRRDIEQNTSSMVAVSSGGPVEISSKYIALARAVLVTSKEDASAYFNEAVKIVSKFGDEIGERWNAIEALAQLATANYVMASDELAYKFIRCAEAVGQYFSDDDHFNRDLAIIYCAKLSSGIGIAALSRWRDRDIGWFDDQIVALSNYFVESKVISPALGWALTPFHATPWLKDYLSVCLQNERTQIVKEKILDDYVQIVERVGAGPNYWKKIQEVASGDKLQNHRLGSIINFYEKVEKYEQKKNSNVETESNDSGEPDPIPKNWNDIFGELDLVSQDGFDKLMIVINERSNNSFARNRHEFWKEVTKRIEDGNIWKFMEIFLESASINFYEIEPAFYQLQETWGYKASFKTRWPEVIKCLGKKYCIQFIGRHTFSSTVTSLKMDDHLINTFREGIIEGLAERNNFADANIFFQFVDFSTAYLTPKDAVDLLDFSLTRFGLHIEEDFGDGPWETSLQVSGDINTNIAGFIWSALGSPRSAMRWQAAHSVRKLADFGCMEVIDALMEWMNHNKVDAFGYKNYPFYNLHARLYLIIALARVSVNVPGILKKHSGVFSRYALSEPHALIQKFAADIAINIERAYPGTYIGYVFALINNVGVSKLPPTVGDYSYVVNSYWHENNELDKEINFNFGLDIDQYWFKPLGNIFGVPQNQVEDLATKIIVSDWGIRQSGDYYKDPRASLWNRRSDEDETWHRHSDYPRTDNLSFYLSYHSMFVVAAMLLDKMPVVSTKDQDYDKWETWMSRHLLTRQDGTWLSDVRDPVPLRRPDWINDNKEVIWQSEISEQDFLNCLKNDNEDSWINVQGHWSEKDKDRTENYSIRTALVSKKTSNSLLHALTTCSNQEDYNLPLYNDDNVEIDSGEFVLKGWIDKILEYDGVDRFDVLSDKLDYSPYSIGEKIADDLLMSFSEDRKKWYCPNSQKPSVVCEMWNSHRTSRDEDPNQVGNRMKATLPFLRHICQTLNYDLIFNVGISRELKGYQKKESGYKRPTFKVYILSADGKLRTTTTSYQLG